MTTRALVSAARALVEMEAAAANAIVPALRAALTTDHRATGVTLWLADYRLAVLQPVVAGESGDAEGPGVPVDGSEAGRVFASQRPSVHAHDGAATVLLPVSVRGNRLGVLEVGLPTAPGGDDLDALTLVASAVGHAIAVANRETDLYERAARTQRLGLAAELQWQLLPGRSCDGEDFHLAGQLEPAYHLSGDNFDWSVNPDVLQVGLTDGMGHGTVAAQLTALGITALRNARRAGLGLADQAALANDAIFATHGGQLHLETLLLAFDRRSPALTVISTGSPRLVRQRGTQVEAIEVERQLPLGLFQGTTYRGATADVAPGDRLVALSDGLHGAGADRRSPFGERRLTAALHGTRHLPPTETVRQLIRQLHEHLDATELGDDATAVVIDWK